MADPLPRDATRPHFMIAIRCGDAVRVEAHLTSGLEPIKGLEGIEAVDIVNRAVLL